MEVNKKRKFTEEHKRKLSEAHKGQIPWSKGKKGLWVAWNKGEKIKLLCAQCGKPFEVLPCRKDSAKFCSERCRWDSTKGKHSSRNRQVEVTCLKCGSLFKRSPAFITNNRGKYCSQKCYWESKEGKPSWNKGKKASEETRNRQSKAQKGLHPIDYYREIGFRGVIKQQTFAPTAIEKKVYEELKARGFLFETQKLINGKFLVDAYIPALNLVIEADGNYWHSLPKAIGRDKAKNAYLKKCGFGLLRLTETEINNGSFKERINKIGPN